MEEESQPESLCVWIFEAGCQLWRGLVDAVRELGQQLDELDNVVGQLAFHLPSAVSVGVLPLVACVANRSGFELVRIPFLKRLAWQEASESGMVMGGGGNQLGGSTYAESLPMAMFTSLCSSTLTSISENLTFLLPSRG